MKKNKSNTLADILSTKCPRCRQGDMFEHKTLHIRRLLKMHRYCPVCGQDFIPEPGFYFGAMYFSYAINVMLILFVAAMVIFVFKAENIIVILTSVFLPPVLLAPWNFRVSRALMLYLFGDIEKEV